MNMWQDFLLDCKVIKEIMQAIKVYDLGKHNHKWISLLQGHPRLVKSIASLFSKLHGRDIQPLSEVAKLAGSITFDNPIKFTLIYIFMLQVLITNGAYESLYCAISAFVNEGDEVMQQLNYLR